METLIEHDRVEPVQRQLKFEGLFTAKGNRRGGGLALFWHKADIVQIFLSYLNFINVKVLIQSVESFIVTSFYGLPKFSRRRDSSNFLRSIASQVAEPWCILGDFNDMLQDSEKRGVHRQPRWCLQGFANAVEDYGLIDLGMEGYPFT
ncbi:hypothetical protein Syun_001513 [Stephania yunnanensis]|uniref:Endonuclease/exonuclease/phosphatase domain-containing protein n=1 Tax=Stephania yunnanensis TaxID=152371 RepID=A0AAP0Q763_9MAGN